MEGQTKPTEINILFNALGSKSSEIRYRALLEAQELTPEQLTRMAEMATRRRSSSLRLNRTKKALGLFMVTGGLFVPANSPVAFFFLTVSSLLALIVCFHVGEWDNYRRPTFWHTENLIRLLEMHSERRSVGAVLLLLEKAEGEQCDRLLKLLLRLLPELRADDAREWTARHRNPFLRVLRSWHKNTELAHAILKAMPEIGGTWALEAVERLAKLKYWHPDRLRSNYTQVNRESLPWQGRLQDDMQPTEGEVEAMLDAFRQIGTVAAEYLPGLRAKIQGEEVAQLLLRAADVRTQPEELLRPAADNGVVIDPASLLRPGALSQETTLTPTQ